MSLMTIDFFVVTDINIINFLRRNPSPKELKAKIAEIKKRDGPIDDIITTSGFKRKEQEETNGSAFYFADDPEHIELIYRKFPHSSNYGKKFPTFPHSIRFGGIAKNEQTRDAIKSLYDYYGNISGCVLSPSTEQIFKIYLMRT